MQIFSFADFERRFGGLDLDSDLSYAVSQFFLNGGSQAWIVRAAAGAAAAAINLRNDPPGGGDVVVLTATARSEGLWGNNLRLTVDHDTASPASLFNLTVSEVQERNGQAAVTRSESYRNLSMNSQSAAYVVDVVNTASNLITLERPGGLAFGPAAVAVSGPIVQADLDRLGDNARRLAIALDGSRAAEFDILAEGDALAGAAFQDRMNNLATRIEAAVQALDPGDDAFGDFACVAAVTGATAVLQATSGTPAGQEEGSSVAFSSAGRRNAAGILHLGAANGGRETSGAAALRPAPSGTAWARQNPALDFATLASPASLDVDLLNGATVLANAVIPLWPNAAGRPADLARLRTQLEAAFRGVARPEFAGARVSVADDRIVVAPGGANPGLRIRFNSGPTAGGADLTANAQMNVGAWQLGIGPVLEAQSDPVPGDDGTPPGPIDLQGSRADKTGIFALEDVDIFNILTIPNQPDPALQAAAIAYAEERRSFAILDLPATVDTVEEARAWLTANGALRHRNAAARGGSVSRYSVSVPISGSPAG